MTSEICLMNRHALVLAADSATTVTRWNKGERELRYFKGANKVFQLSNHHPIGLMIYDSASILKVPWEVVIKEFRKHIGATSFPHVSDYANAFFQFLSSSEDMFPTNVQDEVFLHEVVTAAITILFNTELSDPTDNEKCQEDMDAMVVKIQNEIKDVEVQHSLSDCDLSEFRQRILAQMMEELNDVGNDLKDRPMPSDIEGFAKVVMQILLIEPENWLSTTGLVFAGYGENDIFPAIAEYQSSGILCSTHMANLKLEQKISHNIPVYLSGFAQTSMIDTFQIGVSREIYTFLVEQIQQKLMALKNTVEEKLGTSKSVQKAVEDADLQKLFDDCAIELRRDLLEDAKEENLTPLRNVLSSLPIEEMAELAETLISLQSLKEKVTKPSETVGGPVDVAVITKSEGLVWIKRKHYFDGTINSRFSYRQQNEH